MFDIRIKEVTTSSDCQLIVLFEDGTRKQYDVTQLFFDFPYMKKLEEKEFFQTVTIDGKGHAVSWDDTLDISANVLWENGVTIS